MKIYIKHSEHLNSFAQLSVILTISSTLIPNFSRSLFSCVRKCWSFWDWINLTNSGSYQMNFLKYYHTRQVQAGWWFWQSAGQWPLDCYETSFYDFECWKYFFNFNNKKYNRFRFSLNLNRQLWTKLNAFLDILRHFRSDHDMERFHTFGSDENPENSMIRVLFCTPVI